jgi:hypothetical protein
MNLANLKSACRGLRRSGRRTHTQQRPEFEPRSVDYWMYNKPFSSQRRRTEVGMGSGVSICENSSDGHVVTTCACLLPTTLYSYCFHSEVGCKDIYTALLHCTERTANTSNSKEQKLPDRTMQNMDAPRAYAMNKTKAKATIARHAGTGVRVEEPAARANTPGTERATIPASLAAAASYRFWISCCHCPSSVRRILRS